MVRQNESNIAHSQLDSSKNGIKRCIPQHCFGERKRGRFGERKRGRQPTRNDLT